MDMSSLPKAVQLAQMGERGPRWSPGLAARGGRALHNEVFASGDEGAGTAAALALALDDLSACGNSQIEEKSILWVQDTASIRRNGRPYRLGLPSHLQHRIIHVAAREVEDALFALEEGMRCRDLAFIVGEIAGNPKALDFTASRRLSLTAEKHGVPLFLVRHDASRDLSSARMRWQVSSAASSRPRWNISAPGTPAWHAELFRSRSHAPGEWILRDDSKSLIADRPFAIPANQDGSPDNGDLAGEAGAGSLAAL